MAINYANVAEQILKNCGGCENINNISHCSTRLRLFINNTEKVSTSKIKKLDGVIGAVYTGNELQIILAQNLIPIYSEALKLYEKNGGTSGSGKSTSTNARKESWGARLVNFLSASLSIMIPGFAAGGMLKVILLLITLAWPEFADMSTYSLLSFVADAPFYFMPIFVAYGVAKRLNATPIFAMAVTAGLLYPDFISLLKGEEVVTALGFPVMSVSYKASLLPAILIAVCAYYVEKLLSKIIPSLIRPVLLGAGTISITYLLGVTILGPLGDFIGKYVVGALLWTSGILGPFVCGLLAASFPFLVMTGMHHALNPFKVQVLTDPGYDVLFRPAQIIHNMAEGGACLGIALRTKNKTFRAQCISYAVQCILAGISEPAIYGANLRLKRPMLGVVAGGAVGGVVASMLGAKAFAYGYSSILAIPIFQTTMVAMIIAIASAILVSAGVTFVLGFDEEEEDEEENEAENKTKNETEKKSNNENTNHANVHVSEAKAEPIVAVADGNMINIENVKDEVFSSKMLGDGVAFELTQNVIVAPSSGKIAGLMDTGHAFGIQRNDGVEFLVHVGIDTVKMNGVGFHPLVKEGDTVKAGTPVLEVDLDLLRSKGYDMTTMLIVSNANGKKITFKDYGKVTRGETISL